MIEKKLSTGRKVKIRQMDQDDIVRCEDIPEIRFENGQLVSIRNQSQARIAWIRAGLGGGDFKAKMNGGVPPDEIIKELSQSEQEELRNLIQESQFLGEGKPSVLD